MARNLSLTLAKVVNNTTPAIGAKRTHLSSLARVVMNDCIALDFLLASQAGVCAMVDTSAAPTQIFLGK